MTTPRRGIASFRCPWHERRLPLPSRHHADARPGVALTTARPDRRGCPGRHGREPTDTQARATTATPPRESSRVSPPTHEGTERRSRPRGTLEDEGWSAQSPVEQRFP